MTVKEAAAEAAGAGAGRFRAGLLGLRKGEWEELGMAGAFGSIRRRAAPAAILALALAAAAPDARGGRWYAGLAVPVMFIDDTESTTTGRQSFGQPPAIPYTSKSTSEHETGFKVAGTVGYELGGGFRVEGELFFARAEIAKVTYKGANAAGNPIPLTEEILVSGTADQFGAFASAWYDFRTGTDWIPYVGGGLGFIRVDQSDLDYDANSLANEIASALTQQPVELPPGTVPDISTTDTVLAYHVGIGTGYRLNDNVILQAGYRFQTASDMEFDGRNAAGSIHVASGLRVHLLEIGVRYRF